MIIVTQLADRISIIVKGFFHHRQKASLEPPAQLVVFGLYKKAKKRMTGVIRFLIIFNFGKFND
ncbi:hypothetical protein [Hallerella succinigenes]|uniref:hypothetical protein n=1 Tax=Hallerella succinigenes TaxID=1896222 RepID=UPI000D0D860E|nr:hypothetical protein [Hallerella succinigenes]